MPETSSHTLQDTSGLYRKIKIDQVIRSAHQARKFFDRLKLTNLSESIRQEGLQVPVIVRLVACSDPNCQAPKLDVQDGFPPCPEGSHWHAELVAGERRIRAAVMLGWDTIDAKIIQTASEASAAAKGLIDNLQREDLNPIEEAEGFADLKNLDTYWNQQQIAAATGKSPDYISRSMALLDLPSDIVEKLRQRNLSREHGVELLRLNNAKEIKRMADKVGKKGLTVKQTREAIDRKLGKVPSPPAPPPMGEGGPEAKPSGTGEAAAIRDPLSDIWNGLSSGPENWNVTYDAQGWHFHVQAQGADPKVDLNDWFSRMAKAIAASIDEEEQIRAAIEDARESPKLGRL